MTKKTKSDTFFFKRVIKIPMYYGNFIIIFSNDEVKIRKTVKIAGDLEDFAYTFHNFLYGGKESFAVCFNFWTSEPVSTGTIIHEVNHCGNRLLAARNIDPSWENDEAESYLKGWMADEIEKFMKKCNIV